MCMVKFTVKEVLPPVDTATVRCDEDVVPIRTRSHVNDERSNKSQDHSVHDGQSEITRKSNVIQKCFPF